MISILNVIKDDEILPEYVFKQYMYLRLEYPKAMPDFYVRIILKCIYAFMLFYF